MKPIVALRWVLLQKLIVGIRILGFLNDGSMIDKQVLGQSWIGNHLFVNVEWFALDKKAAKGAHAVSPSGSFNVRFWIEHVLHLREKNTASGCLE